MIKESFDFEECIIEGFICPVCFDSFTKAEILEHHFSTKHSSNTIVNDYQNSNISGNIGYINNRTSEFNKLRRTKINRIGVEINTLLIRLEKLCSIKPTTNSSNRLIQEQAIVPWIEANIDLCPRCGSSFGLTWPSLKAEGIGTLDLPKSNSLKMKAKRHLLSASNLVSGLIDSNPVYRRQHHCRLCGHLICGDCSLYLSIDIISKLSEKYHWQESLQSYDERRNFLLPEVFEKDTDTLSYGKLSLKTSYNSQSSSRSSLQDQCVTKTQVYKLRVCEICENFLKLKIKQIEERHTEPEILHIYQSLKLTINDINKKMPEFTSMANSLNVGEEKYLLEMAKSLRFDLLLQLQKVDSIEKEIGVLLKLNSSIEPFTRQQLTMNRILRAVKQFARQYVQKQLVQLHALPSEENHQRLITSRNSKNSLLTEKTPIKSDLQLARKEPDVAWMPTAPLTDNEESDMPEEDNLRFILMRQIDMVTGYLSEAYKANRSNDEIESLSKNLQELENELRVCFRNY